MKHSVLIPFILFICLLFFNACNEDPVNPNGGNNGTNVKITVAGSVTNESGQTIAGATVTIGGETKSTGSNGEFFFSDITVSATRCYIRSEQAGYFDASTSVDPDTNTFVLVNIKMRSSSNVQIVNGATGGTITLPNGSSIGIQPNSLQLSDGTPYSGNVNVASGYLDPTSNDFPLLIPGGDLSAKRSDSTDSKLFSYGIFTIELSSLAGEQVNLMAGSSATLTFTIPTGLLAAAPPSVRLWFFDNNSGLWREDGLATKQGNQYIGTIAHFTSNSEPGIKRSRAQVESFNLNCDDPFYSATILGRVVNCNGIAIPHVVVAMGQIGCYTDAQGFYSSLVPTGVVYPVRVYNSGVLSSPTVNVGPLSAQQTFYMQHLVIDCPPTSTVIHGTVFHSGNLVKAHLIAKDVSGNIYSTIAYNGNFSLYAKPNTNFTLFVYRNNLSTSMNIITGSAGDSVNVGNIIVK